MIELQSVSKKFVDSWALKTCSWSLKKNRTLGLLGPNGAGKSTTMKIMTGLLRPTSGTVLIGGTDLLADPVESKRLIGYLPETPSLYGDLKAIDNLRFACGLKSVPKNQVEAQVDQAIAKLHLQEVAFKPTRVLSKGFRQRLGIAQALVGDPSVLILDEPSVGLDPQQVIELRQIIKKLKTDHTIILSTHVLGEVQQVCDDVVILDKGEVRSQGALSELLELKGQLRSLMMQVRDSDSTLVEDLKVAFDLPKIEMTSGNRLVLWLKGDSAIDPSPYVNFILSRGNGVLAMEQGQQELEDVFMEVTQ